MKRAELLRRILADCFCRLQPSPLHGVGVFAIRDIPAETCRAGPALFVPTADKMYIPTSGLNVISLTAYINHSPRQTRH